MTAGTILADSTTHARRRRWLALRFSFGEEMQYRESLRRELRPSRTGLFLVLAVGFGLAPFYQSVVFEPTANVLPIVILMEWVVATLALLAAGASYLKSPPLPLARAAQTVAVLAVFAGVMLARYFALQGEMRYPVGMSGVVMIAVAFFGRFDLYRIAPASLMFAGASIFMEFRLGGDHAEALLSAYLLGFMTVITLMGAYTQEVMSRRLWRDMARIEQTRMALRQSEEYYRFMAESSPDHVWTATPEGRMDYVNESACNYTGLAPEQLRRGWLQLLHPDDLAPHQAHWQVCRATGAPFEHEFRLRRHDGEYRWCMARARLMRDDAGRHVKWFGITVDIDDLRTARATAEAVTQAKAAFLADMSHEIRTPMNAIVGMTTILLDSGLSEKQREWTDVIRNSGEHLLAIISDILDFSKIEAGKIDLESQPFALRDCIESAVDLVTLSATKKNIEIGYLMHAEVPEIVRGDVSRLRQILLNLLSNAVKFTPEHGQVTVEVAAPEHARTGEVQISVRDTGIGVSAEQQTRLFQPFSQAHSSTARTYGGTGLGLSICKRLAELMGGRIAVESNPGQGATFSFSIVAPAESPDAPLDPLARDSRLRGRRVLVVDDVEVNRRILVHYAQAWGMEASLTDSPREALAWVERGEPYDLALIDFHMPELDGLELATAMRRHRSTQELPIIMLSSAPVEAAIGAGISAELAKPIKPARLLQTIQRALEPVPAGTIEGVTPAPQLPHDLGQTHPLRILVAEDNPVSQTVVRLLLTHMGYDPEIVANGREALSALAREDYDVVFMDLQMPVMDGIAATRELCARYAERRRPQIIGMTANAMTEDRATAMDAGMQDYIVKPVTPDAIIAALKRCTPLAPRPVPPPRDRQ